MINNSLHEIAEELKKCNSVLLFAHQNPDGDAIGSMFAAGMALRQLGIRVDYRIGEDRSGLAELFGEKKRANLPVQYSYDAALVVDCSTRSYIHDSEKLGLCKKMIVIDHHDSNEGFGDMCHVEADSSSAAEIVYLLVRELGVEITSDMARAIYVGIVTDTGNFIFSNTTARTHRIVSELYEYSDDFYEICEYIKTKDMASLKILKIGLDNVEFYAGGKLAVTSITYEDGLEPDTVCDTDPLTNAIRYTKGVLVAVMIKQKAPDTYKISMRSAEDRYDVSIIAKQFGGGGHIKAAGFDFKGDLNDLKEYFIKYSEIFD